MARINPRTKGASGEREFCRWLAENFNVPPPQRNLEQVRSGGSDVIDVEPFYFEVKRCEALSFEAWWRQVRKAVIKACDNRLIPVVAYRQNKQPWRFLISAEFIGVDKGFLHVSERVFIRWARDKID